MENDSRQNSGKSQLDPDTIQLFKTVQIRVSTERPHLVCQPERVLLPPIPPGVEVRVPIRLSTSHPIRSEFIISVCWPVPEAGQMDLGSVEAADLECPFTAEFPSGQGK